MWYCYADAFVAQLDRASPSGGEGQRFESSRTHHYVVQIELLGHYCSSLIVPLSSTQQFCDYANGMDLITPNGQLIVHADPSCGPIVGYKYLL